MMSTFQSALGPVVGPPVAPALFSTLFLEARHEKKAPYDYRRHRRGVVLDRSGSAAFHQRQPIQADPGSAVGRSSGPPSWNWRYRPLDLFRWSDGFGYL